METYPTNVEQHEDGSYTIHVGDVSFGPYGPGQCEAVYPRTDHRCGGMKNHGGCHTSEDGDDKLPTWRWW